MRAVGSSQADPFLATAAAAAALSGPLHGGANEEVLRMLDEIGSKDHVPAYIDSVKAGTPPVVSWTTPIIVPVSICALATPRARTTNSTRRAALDTSDMANLRRGAC